MNVLMGNTYFLKRDPSVWSMRQPYAPLGTLIAAAMVRQAGHNATLFDATLADDTREWTDHLHSGSVDVAVIYDDNFNYLSKMCLLTMREAAHDMLGAARRAGVPALICSADSSDQPAAYLAAGATAVILGEGESTLAAVLADAERSGFPDLQSRPGLVLSSDPAYRTRADLITDLDNLARPAWDLVDIEAYRRIWMRHHGYFSMNMVTTRGCPYHCNWCAKPIWGQRYNSRSAASVVAEQASLVQQFNPDHIWFMDDIWGLKPDWIAEYASETGRLECRRPFKCLSRADLLLRNGEIEALETAGCDIVWLGAESGSQSVLDAMDKGTRVEQIREARQKLAAAGIRVGFFLQMGYPGETLDDLRSTRRMVNQLMPDEIGISVSYPLPGTPFHDMVKGQLGDKKNWQDSADLAMLYRGPYRTEFYRQYKRVISRGFRVRQAFRRLTGQTRAVDRNFSKARELAVLLYSVIVWAWSSAAASIWRYVPHQGIHALPERLSPNQASTPSPQE